MTEFNDRREVDPDFVYWSTGGRTVNRQKVYQTAVLHKVGCPTLRGGGHPIMKDFSKPGSTARDAVVDRAQKGLAGVSQYGICKRCKPHEALRALGHL